MNLTYDDQQVMARTLYGEARGGGETLMRCTGHVIMNRVRDNRWPDSPAKVCLQPHQFSCWSGAPAILPDFHTMMMADLNDPLFLQANIIALSCMGDRYSEDITKGANMYYAQTISAPSWVQRAQLMYKYG